MRRTAPVLLTALVAWLVAATPASADWWCRLPSFRLDIRIERGPAFPPPPAPLVVPPAAPAPLPPAVLPGPPAAPALTLKEFAASFRPAPGNYEVTLLHTRTGCPVTVCFTLPPGCPRKVKLHRHELEFDYGKHEVSIRFQLGGRVKVSYD
jgi:hypothetical protein